MFRVEFLNHPFDKSKVLKKIPPIYFKCKFGEIEGSITPEGRFGNDGAGEHIAGNIFAKDIMMDCPGGAIRDNGIFDALADEDVELKIVELRNRAELIEMNQRIGKQTEKSGNGTVVETWLDPGVQAVGLELTHLDDVVFHNVEKTFEFSFRKEDGVETREKSLQSIFDVDYRRGTTLFGRKWRQIRDKGELGHK
jgi:hypothetical protein